MILLARIRPPPRLLQQHRRNLSAKALANANLGFKRDVDLVGLVNRQGDLVRALKARKAPKEEIDAAVTLLKDLKFKLQEFEAASPKEEASQDESSGTSSQASGKRFREAVTNALERRMFFTNSFGIYGGVAGLFDYGPPGCAVKANVLSFWRQHFVVNDDLLEVDCPCLTPEAVLRASGHVEKFTDLMVRDVKEGHCFRADHVLKDFLKDALEKDPRMPAAKRDDYTRTLASLDDFSAEELGAKIKEYGIRAPDTKNDLSDPFPFNLMFGTPIGPTGLLQGYLRPETAQGIFVNFNELLYYNGGKLPFGAAQIGQAFRNEIAPRQGLLRVREFTLAEIEFFVDPADKSHPKFASVADLEFFLYPRAEQMSLKDPVKVRLGHAVAQKVINNETLGYYIGRTYLFLTALGINKNRLRFRQHLANEMAHYAADCWDAEIECSYGWIECVGLADRSAYDLKAHSTASKSNLVASRDLPEPVVVEEFAAVPNRKEIGVAFKANQKLVLEALQELNNEEALEMQKKLESDGEAPLHICNADKTFTIKKGMVTFNKQVTKKSKEKFTPSVIEPSFGIGRIIYCLFEHCFDTRGGVDGQLNVFRFPALVAPVKCTVFPLVQNPKLDEIARAISAKLREAGIANKIDTTGRSIGRRYARTDEIGVPFAITVDSEDGVTVRDRDSKDQIRVPLEEVVDLIADMSAGKRSWKEVQGVYPAHVAAKASDESDE
ncbi:glycine--tRNA ligase, mitochondrial 1 [Selaginella moellendorffii]|uniref:glycine--tRNA ligase, mitochondrial 1 n=1 Tax=Selaginella moellendorffii TaxID=88036 RepID=UPI000D1C38D0|nr:glycine--tRNA ligase, mitochondrial 1 [Selaginella moellendorffii]|eukprot:XP_024519019.1 glycine--tRNA ligase, mitochondrial 1 [Selaginella moellendorffii]